MSITNQLPARPEPPPQPPYRVLRLVASLVTALVIAATSYLCAWRTVGDHWYAEMGPQRTRWYMRELRKEIEQYRARNGRLPASLADLEGNLSEQLPDGWGRPFVYEVDGDTYELYSLGRDGRPGGSGLDSDIRSEVVDSSREHLTLWEFSRHQDIRGVQMSCILAGLLALPIA